MILSILLTVATPYAWSGLPEIHSGSGKDLSFGLCWYQTKTQLRELFQCTILHYLQKSGVTDLIILLFLFFGSLIRLDFAVSCKSVKLRIYEFFLLNISKKMSKTKYGLVMQKRDRKILPGFFVVSFF